MLKDTKKIYQYNLSNGYRLFEYKKVGVWNYLPVHIFYTKYFLIHDQQAGYKFGLKSSFTS